MLFYFVRHGETGANRTSVLAGSGLDHELTDHGHNQAKALGETVKDRIAHPLHRLLVSDMRRARQTAAYLSAQLNLPAEIVSDFREWHLGEWEGKTYEEYGHLLLGDGEPKQGESRKTFYSRIEQAWKSNHSNSHPYIVVSHGAVWLALQDFLQVPRFAINNCDLVKVESHGGRWRAQII